MHKLYLVLLMLPLALPVRAQAIDPSFASPTSLYAPGRIFSLGPDQADGKRVLAGIFTRMNGQSAEALVRLTASGSLDQDFQRRVGIARNIFRVRPGLGGQYLLGAVGGDVVAGGLLRADVLRLNADGTADASFDPGTGPTLGGDEGTGEDYAVQPDGKVLVGGSFDAYSGVPAAGLVRLNANGSLDQSFGVGSGVDAHSGDVSHLLVQPDGKILVGGYFATFNGRASYGLARLNPNGSVDATFTFTLPATSFVNGLVAQPDGKVLVSGYLGTTQLLRLNANGSLDTGFSTDNSLPNSAVFSTSFYGAPMSVQADGKILVTGNFQGGGVHLLRLNANGSLDATFSPSRPPSQTPSGTGVQPGGGILVVSSAATNAFGPIEGTAALFSASGAYQASYAPNPQVAGSISALLRLADGSLLVGGNFTEWNGQPLHQLVHLSSTGTLDAAFVAQTTALPGSVQSLATQPDGRFLVGTSLGVRRIFPAGGPDASFSSPVVSASSLAVQADGKVLVAGMYGINMGTTNFRGLTRLNPDGSLDPSFVRTSTYNNLISNWVDGLLLQPDGKIVATASYSGNGTTPVTYAVRYTSTGALDASFTPQKFTAAGNISRVYALARQPDGSILAGGRFNEVGGVTQAGVARLTPTGAVDASFVTNNLLQGTVYSLGVQPNGRVLLGGGFTLGGRTDAYFNLGRLLASGQVDDSFTSAASPDGTVRSLVLEPSGGLVLGGEFKHLGTQSALAVAHLTAATMLAVAAPNRAIIPSAWPIPARDQLHLSFSASSRPQLAELLDLLGRPVRQLPLAGSAEAVLPVGGLPAGTYVLRVRYAEGTSTQPLVVE